jgi:hypothetical protein
MKENQPKQGSGKKGVGKYKRLASKFFERIKRIFKKKRHFYRLEDIEKRIGGGKK